MTFDCADPYGPARWWSQATGRPLTDSDPGDHGVVLEPPAEGRHQPRLLFLRVPDGKSVKNRVHLDVRPTDGRTRDEEADRLIALGARVYEDHRKPDGGGWVTLLDPEGNEFCVCRGAAERQAVAPTS